MTPPPPVPLSPSPNHPPLSSSQAAQLTVDLAAQTIRRPDGSTIPFDVDESRRHCLLNPQGGPIHAEWGGGGRPRRWSGFQSTTPMGSTR